MPNAVVALSITVSPRVNLIIKTREEFQAEMAKLPTAHQRLVFLTELLAESGRDGLHTFFFLDKHSIAPLVLGALSESHLTREAAIFKSAIALFGPTYGLDHSKRETRFAWSQPGKKIDDVTSIPNELNTFDLALMALAKEFGSRQEMVQLLETTIRQDPELSALVAAARSTLGEDDRLNFIAGSISERVMTWDSPTAIQRQLAELPEPHRAVVLIWMFEAEMLNGGVHQYFYNSTGATAPDLVWALRHVGLDKHASAVQRGIEMFPQPYPRDTTQRRERHFSRSWSAFDDKLEQLTAEVDDGSMHGAMLKIARDADILPK